jgi:Holliday junction resolvase RusA-like endonuclease
MPSKKEAPDRGHLTAALMCHAHLDLDGAEAALARFSERDLQKAAEFARAQQDENGEVDLYFEIAGSPPISKRPRMRRDGSPAFNPDGDDKLILGQLIQLQIPRGTAPLEGHVQFFMDIYRDIPSSMPEFKRALAEIGYIRPETKPDFDNYAKIAVDAMIRRAFKDDGLVAEGTVRKFFSARPRIELLVRGRRRRMYK